MDKPGHNIDLSVITPIYNEEAIIIDSVKKMINALENLQVNWELILVNDGSTDNTLKLIRKAAKYDERIRILSYDKNRGRGHALRTGFNNSYGNYVITTESDMTWGDDIFFNLYNELLNSGTDVVIASPYKRGGKLENIPFKRALLSMLGNILLRMSVAPNITMVSGMTRGYKGDMIRNLSLEEDGKEIHLEIISKASALNYKFTEIPAILSWKKLRNRSNRVNRKFKSINLIKSHLLFGFNEAPIIFFGGLGAIILLTGFFIGLYLSYLFLIKGEIIGNRVILIITTVFLILSGLQVFLFCFLAYQNKNMKKDLYKLRINNTQLKNMIIMNSAKEEIKENALLVLENGEIKYR